MLAALSQLAAVAIKGGFLSTSEEEWAEETARQVYSTERQAATFATCTVRLTNAGGGSFSGNAGELVVKNSATDITYRNTAPYTLSPLGTADVEVMADTIGSVGTSLVGEIDTMVTTLLSVTCSNTTAAIGIDAESIADLKVRAIESLGAVSPNGPADAYSYFAKKSVRPDGTLIGITRVRCIPDGLAGVDVYLATAAGPTPGSDVTLVNEDFQLHVVPIPVTCRTHSATAKTYAPTYTVWIPSQRGLSAPQVQTAIAAALATYLESVPIGGYKIGVTSGIWSSEISAVIGTAVQAANGVAGIVRVSLSTPDMSLAENEVAILGSITATVNLL
jgi:hypothetical protein